MTTITKKEVASKQTSPQNPHGYRWSAYLYGTQLHYFRTREQLRTALREFNADYRPNGYVIDK